MQKKLIAEFFGMFRPVFGGCGSAVLAAAFPQIGIGLLGVSLAFGLTVLTMVYAVGPISGGHFNPAVSVGLAVAGRFPWSEFVPYVMAQVVGTTARTFSSAAARPNAAMSCSSKGRLNAFTGGRARLISAIWSETSYRKSSSIVTAGLLMYREADRER